MTAHNKAIDEVRHEYKEKQAELKKYDSFLDRHQGLVVFVPLLLVLIGVMTIVGLTESATPGRSSGNLAVKIIGIMSFVVLIGAVVMAFITGSRKSAKAKINKQLVSLKKDVALLHEHGKTHENITRDELGLWRDIEKDSKADNSNKGGWVMGLIVIVVIAAVVSMGHANQRNQEAAERARQAEIVEQQQAKQRQDALEQQKIDQQNEANRLQQQQNAIDMYNATKPSNNNNYRSGTSCTSRAIGSTVYTDCD